MLRRVLLGLGTLAILGAVPFMAGAFGSSETSGPCACCDNCGCEGCRCDDAGCACDSGGACACTSACMTTSSCCEK